MNGITPGFLLLLASLCIALLSVRREAIVVPLIVAMCFLPADISLQVLTLDFSALRILSLVGLARLYLNPTDREFVYNKIDVLFISYQIIGSVVYVLASSNHVGALIFKSGSFVDSIVLYLVFRHTIQSEDTLRLVIQTFTICILLLLPFVIYEFFSAQNLFSVLGRDSISMRDGVVRATGTFSHSILFGSFAAAVAPLCWANYKIKESSLALFCFACCLFYIYASSSSGPLVSLAGVLFFLFMFLWKHHGSIIAWALILGSLTLHFIREGPIWGFLYVRISIKASSAGYHRYLLVEAAIDDFKNWWLFGFGDRGPRWHLDYWPWTHATFTDVTNHYLLEGVRGGFITMVLFIWLCLLAIKTLWGHSASLTEKHDQWLWWGFTVAMIAHCITFLAVAYFGQITMLFYLTVAVAALAYGLQHPKTEFEDETAEYPS